MKHSYDDITSRIEEKPAWWDEHGVPRYGEFEPGAVPDIYAREAVLFLVECQCCRREFHVCKTSRSRTPERDVPLLQAQIGKRWLEYGDPPNVGCCPAGATMNSVTRRVLQYWSRSDGEWKRNPEFEVDDITPSWMRETG